MEKGFLLRFFLLGKINGCFHIELKESRPGNNWVNIYPEVGCKEIRKVA
jgi:hypothetical protein